MRCEFKGQVTVKLMAAKARLAPMKKSSISGVELLGAALENRALEHIRWKSSEGNQGFDQYIDDWRHVPAEVNPADLATRCCDWSDLLNSKWWESPGWLYSNEESWPCSEVSETPYEAFLERRKTVVTNLATGNEVRFGDRFLYFSSYKKILRMTAYVLRFCNNIKRNSPKLVNSLSCEKIQKAEETLIKIMRSEWPSEIREKYKDTMQFFDENGILKVPTRLILSQDSEDFTHLTVLPDPPLLERLVLYTHRSLMHAGVLTTLAQSREKFRIPKGRRVIRAILRHYIKCKRLTAGKVNPDPAPLPPDRIHRVAAFRITGADLAGPLSLRGSKAWTVHLELVPSLSTESNALGFHSSLMFFNENKMVV
ncbi:dual 3',5'-cyclic-AMP and-GMP phosphodiesterase 11 [Trichonephila clavipes]|nr:dual 3',5'-cyclic-AMP and-GMP phosphodiesterase 11 [Trichonephila clavipes]